MVNLKFTAAAMEDHHYWKSYDPGKAAKIKTMLENIIASLPSGGGRVYYFTGRRTGNRPAADAKAVST